MFQKVEVKVPELGEGIESAQISSIMVKTGQPVQKEQSLIEVESDKASIEIPAPMGGIVKEIYVQNGQSIQIGQTILSLEALSSENKPDADATQSLPSKTAKDAKDTIKEASPTHQNQAAASAPTSPPAAASLYTPRDSFRDTSFTNRQTEDAIEQSPKPSSSIPVPAAPSVRRLARELGANIYSILGSGLQGRISIQDVKAHVKSLLVKSLAAEGRAQLGAGQDLGTPSSRPRAALPDFSQFGPIRREKMQGIRQKISEKMQLSWQEIPHVTQFDEAEITALENFRQRKNKELQKEGIKLTVTSLALKVSALALRKFPQFNASIDAAQQEIIYKDYVHIGIAVDTARGLMVPVLRDADQKDILSIAQELNTLAEQARTRKIQPRDLQGSCLSLTNLGALGTTHFTPIVNWPEAAVLGLGRAKPQLALSQGLVQQQLMLPLSLSYDHRLIDGAQAARFLRWIAENLEYPLSL